MNKMKVIFVGVLILMLFTGCSETKNNVTANSVSNMKENTDLLEQQARERFLAFVKKNGMVLQHESEYCNFFSRTEDKQSIKDLLAAFEDNYARITNNLQVKLGEKVEIYIYPDLSTYHEAVNINLPLDEHMNLPDDKFADAIPGHNIIRMVHPSKVTTQPYDACMKTIVHEFTHVVVTNINPDANSIPIWLNEGIATYEAGQDEWVKQLVTDKKSSNQIPTLESLETDSVTFGNIKGYQFSYSIVEYLVKTYGYDKLVALIKTPSEFEKIFGLSKKDFEKEWIDHIK